MSRAFQAAGLDTVATFWRIYRRDGMTLGFTAHDRDLRFDGILHRAAPGMVPSAIRRTADLSDDSAEMSGVLSHASITAADLALGRFDDATLQVGVVDWRNVGDTMLLYTGHIGSVEVGGTSFTADLTSAKAALDHDLIPQTSPTCRAQFCGLGCGLSAPAHGVERIVESVDRAANAVRFADIDREAFVFGHVRWLDGAHTGLFGQIVDAGDAGLILDTALPPDIAPGDRAALQEGCDHTLATCHARFGNAVNFQGEPFLPGNDLLARYPAPQ